MRFLMVYQIFPIYEFSSIGFQNLFISLFRQQDPMIQNTVPKILCKQFLNKYLPQFLQLNQFQEEFKKMTHSQNIKDCIYRCKSMGIKFSLGSLYPELSSRKKKQNGQEEYTLKNLIVIGLLSLTKNKRTKTNIENLLLKSQKELKLTLENFKIGFKNTNFEEFQLVQLEIREEISKHFFENSKQFWVKYDKSKENQQDSAKLKLLVNHNIICEKIKWKFSDEEDTHRENHKKKFQQLKENASCLCKVQNIKVPQGSDHESTNFTSEQSKMEVQIDELVEEIKDFKYETDQCESQDDLRVSQIQWPEVLVKNCEWDPFSQPKLWKNPIYFL